MVNYNYYNQITILAKKQIILHNHYQVIGHETKQILIRLSNRNYWNI